AAALEKQAWYRTGQTQLSESMIGEQALPTLGQNVLGFLARYLGMSVGALYVTQDGKLQRVAEFGWDRERLQSGRALELGEGLVGQVALERRVMRLDNVPQGYLSVSSALGSADAASVLIFPVEDSGMVNAVLEIGFLRPLLDDDRELLQRVSENIGSAIEAARYRQRLQRMLAETQQLNEE
ncbi:MAG TPA: two-component system sensor histidine kinase/response regulator, partial [Pseudomonas sp.]|nr:two-component system sensor histidine kinase/response regulator [Pseudomonas sp.]